MKIGINATFLNEKPTGLGVFTREICRHFAEKMQDTIIFTSVPLESVQGIQIMGSPVSVRGSERLLNNFNRLLYTNLIMPFLIKKYDVDVLYNPMLEFPIVSLCTQVVMVHDLHPVYFSEQFGLSSAYFRFLLGLLHRLARKIVVPSSFVKNELIRFSMVSEGDIEVVPLGYDDTHFKPQDGESKKDFLRRYGIEGSYILFVGNLFPYKNVETLIETFLSIKRRIPHSLVIAGRRQLSSTKLPEHKRIIYLDYVEKKHLPPLYSFADLLVHPSLAEGFGMTILEAMACGTPVISSNRGSLPEVVGDAGLLFNPEDRESLAELILTVINNEQLRRELIEKGLKHVKGFSWEKTAEGILQSCEKAFKEKR